MSLKDFEVTGTQVSVDQLLKLQMLALDLKRLRPPPAKSRRIGEQRSKYRGQGREFVEMKHYQQGDDVRQIDWRLTAKKQEPFVRVMEEDRHSEHVVWLPLSARHYFGTQRCFKSVLACHWAAFLIWRFAHLKHPVRLIIQVGNHWEREIKVQSSRAAAEACQLIALSHEHLASHWQTMNEMPELQIPHWQGHPNLWIISDFLDHPLSEFETAVTEKPVSTLTCLQYMDSFDSQLPNAGELPVKSRQKVGYIHSSSATVRKSYQEAFSHQQTLIQKFCWQHQGQHVKHFSHNFEWKEVQSWPLYH